MIQFFLKKCVSFSQFDCLLNKGVFMLQYSRVWCPEIELLHTPFSVVFNFDSSPLRIFSFFLIYLMSNALLGFRMKCKFFPGIFDLLIKIQLSFSKRHGPAFLFWNPIKHFVFALSHERGAQSLVKPLKSFNKVLLYSFIPQWAFAPHKGITEALEMVYCILVLFCFFNVFPFDLNIVK